MVDEVWRRILVLWGLSGGSQWLVKKGGGID